MNLNKLKIEQKNGEHWFHTDCAEPGKEIDELLKIFSSFISVEISDFQTDVYYQNLPVVIEKGAVVKADESSARATAPFFYLILCQSI